MYTTRGYRQKSKENRNISHKGQIIQKQPIFQIDNNPVVLDAYKKFIFSTMPAQLLTTQLNTDNYEIELTDISWSQQTSLPDITDALILLANHIFNQVQSLGKFPISLEFYSPNLDDTNVWRLVNKDFSSTKQHLIKYSSIIIDISNNLSYTQNYPNTSSIFSVTGGSSNKNNMTLGYGPLSSIANVTFGNPTAMKVSVNYFTFYNSN